MHPCTQTEVFFRFYRQ